MKVQGPQGASTHGVDAAAAKRAADAAAARKEAAEAGSRSKRETTTEGVSVTVSPAAARRLAAASVKPSFDADKVERLRAVLETGPLQVDSVAVARRLLPSDDGDETT